MAEAPGGDRRPAGPPAPAPGPSRFGLTYGAPAPTAVPAVDFGFFVTPQPTAAPPSPPPAAVGAVPAPPSALSHAVPPQRTPEAAVTAPPAEPTAESGLRMPTALAVTALGLLASVVLMVASRHLEHASDVYDTTLRRGLVITLVFYLAVGSLLAGFVTRRRVRLVWHRRGVGHALALGLPVGLLGGLAAASLNSAFAGHIASDPRIEALVGGGGFLRIGLTLATTVVLAPLVEETLFRGICAGSLLARGVRPAFIVSALAFAVWHLNPTALRYYLLMGLIFALLWFKRGLLASMSAHAGFNGVLTLAAVLATTGVGSSASLGQVSVELPGGWHVQSADTTPFRVVADGPAGAGMAMLTAPEPPGAQTAAEIYQRVVTIGASSGDTTVIAGSARLTRTTVGDAVAADVTVAGQPGHVLEIPLNGNLYELVMITSGSPSAEHAWQQIAASLRSTGA